MAGYIHGATDEVEVARLERQAVFCAPPMLADVKVPAGARLLDLATGVGAMARELAARLPGVRVLGVDLSRAQLLAAKARGGRDLVNADAATLPYRDASFDAVHASWFLEHVREPLPILREVRRVLKPGARFFVGEVENASMLFHPRLPKSEALFQRLCDAQVALGGDPYVGRKLYGLLEAAGFRDLEVRPVTVHGNAGDPAYFRALVEEFAEIFESVEESVGPGVDVRAAVDELRGLPAIPGASMTYTFFLGRGRR